MGSYLSKNKKFELDEQKAIEEANVYSMGNEAKA